MSYIQKISESVQYMDSLNQRIWESGFDTYSLKYLDKIVSEIENGTKVFERIPQEQQSGLSKGSSILTAAAIICRGCPGTKSEVREIYDTEDLIGEGAIQERLVEIWALISLKHYNVLRLALDRIIIHNALFPKQILIFRKNVFLIIYSEW